MGFRDFLKKTAVDQDADSRHVDALDYFEEVEREELLSCLECAREQKHVRLVRTESEGMECPECHYILRRGRRVYLDSVLTVPICLYKPTRLMPSQRRDLAGLALGMCASA